MAHIEKRGRGRWRARYREPSGRERSRTFSHKVEAEAFIASVEVDKLRGVYHDPTRGRETLEQVRQRWRIAADGRLRPSTLGLMDLHWRVHVEPRLGHRSVNMLSRLDVQELVSGMLGSGRSVYTAETALRLLRRLLAAAVDDGLLVRSPADGVRAPRRPHRPIQYLDAEQVSQIAESVPDGWRAFILVAAYGGLRFGELTALRLRHIDFIRRTVRVEDSLVEVGGQLHAGSTKNGRGRAVTLPAFVIEAVAEHVRVHPPGDSGFVFSGPDGNPIRRSNWYKSVWWPTVRKLGLPVKFHALRHTSAALAIAAGAHPKTIQTRLGHHSAAFTLDVYGALFEGLDGELANRLDAAHRNTESRPAAAALRPVASK